ncbi:hypothetical protein C8N46_101300 [Kordia periserrulae]|uniref:Uncharacterized protein n=1 Tax=Kordia periserrulae TaxID=701523 RepID=A0A2T6C5X9_9FLAO|nr:hypothetical protein [Kordia periserrulae]PTX63696.1 hypothetical protein C8N46_101300 [Kordia periserrulae]
MNHPKETNEFSEHIERWAHEDMLQLTHHFHRLKGEQYERTSDFDMDKVEDVIKFEGIKKTIKRLRIYLALNPPNKAAFTFFPVLEVLTDDDKLHQFKLHATENRKSSSGDLEVVPKLFKDMICQNWDTIDANLVDDLFFASKKAANGFDTLLRVQYFEVKEKILTEVIRKLPELTGITLYSGIDMNKFSDKTQISFTPVLGFQYDSAVDKNDLSFGLKSVLEFSKGETFIEYSSPCPPTC